MYETNMNKKTPFLKLGISKVHFKKIYPVYPLRHLHFSLTGYAFI